MRQDYDFLGSFLQELGWLSIMLPFWNSCVSYIEPEADSTIFWTEAHQLSFSYASIVLLIQLYSAPCCGIFELMLKRYGQGADIHP